MERRENLAVALSLVGFLLLLPSLFLVSVLVVTGGGRLSPEGLGLLLVPPVLCVTLIVTARKLAHRSDIGVGRFLAYLVGLVIFGGATGYLFHLWLSPVGHFL